MRAPAVSSSRGCSGKAEDPGVLHVFGQCEEARLDHQRAQPAANLPLPKPEVFGDRRAEGAATDNDDVKWPSTFSPPCLTFGKVVAKVTPLHILGEGGGLAGFCHLDPPGVSRA